MPEPMDGVPPMSSEAPQGDKQVYRPGRGQLIFAFMLLVGLGLFAALQGAVGVARGSVSVAGAIASGVGIYGVFALLTIRVLVYPRLILGGEVITVVNPIVTRHVKWTDIDAFDITTSYSGLAIHLTDGSTLIAMAVTKSNLMMWLRRQTRADEIVAELNERLLHVR
jgi:hypothetical protein